MFQLIPLIAAAIGAGLLKGHGERKQAEAAEMRKEQKSSTDAFIKVLGELSQAGNVKGVQGLQDKVLQLPQGEALYEGALAQAQSGQLKQQSTQALIASMFGGSGQGQGDVPSTAGGGTPGPLLPAEPSAPTSPQQDLSGVSQQIATMNQIPTLQRTPQQVAQRGQMIDEESRLTDAALAPAPLPRAIGKTSAGRVLYQDPRTGEKYSEKTITIEDDRINGGKPTNIPTVFGGRQLGDEDAIKRVVAAKGKDPETGAALDPFNSIQEAVTSARQRSNDLGMTMQEDKVFPTLPGLLKSPGVTTVTIPKDIFGIEIHGSKAEALSGVIGHARQRGFTSQEIYHNLKQQGIDPPEALAHQAFNEFAGKYLTSEEFLKNPRKALQEIASNFPSTDPKALISFGQQAFTSAYVGAKERLRRTGQYVSDRQLSQAAFTEATGAVGSEFVPDAILQDLDRSKANTTENLMAELLDKGLAGDQNALAHYNVLLQLNAQKIGSEEAARQMAQIRTKQAAEFVPTETLKDLEGKGGRSMPFGTTPAQAAGQAATIIKPEAQAARTQRSTETDKMQFIAQRALPVMEGAQARAIALMDKVTSTGFVGKAGALAGLPSQLGQELTGYNEYRVKFIGNLRSLAGETSGVITDKDIDRFTSLFPEGKAFVNLMVDRHEQLIKNFSEMESILSDRLGQPVHPFKDIITKLQSRGASKDTFGDTLKDFDKAMKGTK